jgi:hypothetical protein
MILSCTSQSMTLKKLLIVPQQRKEWASSKNAVAFV